MAVECHESVSLKMKRNAGLNVFLKKINDIKSRDMPSRKSNISIKQLFKVLCLLAPTHALSL